MNKNKEINEILERVMQKTTQSKYLLEAAVYKADDEKQTIALTDLAIELMSENVIFLQKLWDLAKI